MGEVTGAGEETFLSLFSSWALMEEKEEKRREEMVMMRKARVRAIVSFLC